MKSFRKKSKAIKKHSLVGKIPYHVEFDAAPRKDSFAYCRELLESTTLHALPDFFTASKTFYRVVWGIVFIFALIACSFHLYVMLAEIVDSPTVSRNSYEFAHEMAFPRLEICAQLGRMLDTLKLKPAIDQGEITIEYFYALELGMGIFNHHDKALLTDAVVNFTKVEEEYNRAISIHGTIMEAWRDFYRNYGLTCKKLIHYCTTGTFREVKNCCDYFDWVDTLFGRCLVTKNETALTVKYRGNMAGYHFWFWSFDSFILQRVNETQSRVNYAPQAHIVGLSNGLDQTLQWPDPYYLNRQNSVAFALRQRRRKLIPSPNCVINPQLKYFPNYTLTNCVWEQSFIDRLPTTINFTCTLPIITMLNSSTSNETNFNAQNLCNFKDIRRLYTLENKFDVGIHPYSMWQVFAKVDSVPRALNDDADPCPLPCEYTEFLYTATQVNDSALHKWQFEVQMNYPTLEYELVEEVPRLSLSDFVCLIGGAFGLWLGASLVTLIHLVALLANAAWNHFMKPKLRRSHSLNNPACCFDENARNVNLTSARTSRF